MPDAYSRHPIAHELVHVLKYERFGGIEPYLKAYVPEIVSPPTIRMVHSSRRQGDSSMLFAPVCPKHWPIPTFRNILSPRFGPLPGADEIKSAELLNSQYSVNGILSVWCSDHQYVLNPDDIR
jgi:hypothetical protein